MLTVRNGIYCEVRNGTTVGVGAQLGSSDEEWRCKKCAKKFEENLVKRTEEAGSDQRADDE